MLNSRKDWVNFLIRYDIPVAPVLNLSEAFKEYGKELIYEIGGIKYVKFPINFEKYSKDNYKLKAPRLGEHTKEILGRLGFNEKEIILYFYSQVLLIEDN